MKTFNTLLATVFAVVAVGATQLSCSVNDYCLNCGTGDGGNGSDDDANDGGGSGSDAGMDVACVPTGTEICDGKDNDCNGLVDDGVLPEVGDLCANQMGACSGGTKVCDSTAGVIKCNKNPMPEACNNIDDNCNGTVDEGDPGGGAKCGTEAGACVAGTERCTNGTVQCIGFQDHTGDPEVCNGQDDDCDGAVDDNIGSLGKCGPIAKDGVGICVAGTLMCAGGVPTCMGAVFPKFETCNHLDDDCDGTPDQLFNTQTDPNNCGDCVGTGFNGVVCATPSKTCINATNAGATCTDVSTCTGNSPQKACAINSQRKCTAGACGIQCNAGYYNLNGNNADGCEYKCSPTGPEECDGIDNDCDGLIDVKPGGLPLTPPPICSAGGECSVGQTPPGSAPKATCSGAGGWTCTYLGDVGDEICDDKNNDCDANTDEGYFPTAQGKLKHAQCDDGDIGACRDFGTMECKPDHSGVECKITTTTLPSAEDCNGVDDDCDNKVDESATGTPKSPVTGQEWISIGNGVQMMAYEASRPDATDTAAGGNESIVCSRPGRAPWTNVTYPKAAAACAAVGGRLCTEQEWHRTCSVVAAVTTPFSVNNAGTTIEAENYTAIAYATQPAVAESGAQCAEVPPALGVDDDLDGLVNDGCPPNGAPETGLQCFNSSDDDGDGKINDGCPTNAPVTRSWVSDYTVVPFDTTNANATFSGISSMEATPNSGATITLANAPTQAPRMDYDVNITQTGTYHIYVRMFANAATDDTLYVGMTGKTTQQVVAPSIGTWVWKDAAGTFNVTSTGNTTISVWMGKDGVKIDQIRVTTSGTLPTDPPRATLDGSRGNTWAFTAVNGQNPLANPNVYNGNVCNGADLDTDANLAGNQDDILKTGSLTQCFANVGTGVYDMSGNVKEWTVAHAPGENPIRGGASNNSALGISCALNFTLADDALLLPNIGFRCCK